MTKVVVSGSNAEVALVIACIRKFTNALEIEVVRQFSDIEAVTDANLNDPKRPLNIKFSEPEKWQMKRKTPWRKRK